MAANAGHMNDIIEVGVLNEDQVRDVKKNCDASMAVQVEKVGGANPKRSASTYY